MSAKNIILSAATVLLLCTSCADTVNVEVPVYSVDVKQRAKPDKFFSGWDYVMLETNANCLLTNVSKARIDEQRIALLDRDRIFLFTRDGKYKGKIDKLGRGAQEYLSIDDFCLHDSLVYTLSRGQKAISVYTESGHFVRRIDLDDWYRSFEMVDDSLLFLCSEFCNDKHFNFVLLNYHTGKQLKALDPFDANEGALFDGYGPFCERTEDGYFVTHPFDYTVYKLNRDEISPYCRFQFNTSVQIDQSASFEENSENTKNKNAIKYLSDYIETETAKYALFDLFVDEQGIGTYLSSAGASGKTYMMSISEEFLPDFPYMLTPIVGHHDNALVSVVSSAMVLNKEKMYGLSFFTDKGLTEEDNHIIFFHKLK